METLGHCWERVRYPNSKIHPFQGLLFNRKLNSVRHWMLKYFFFFKSLSAPEVCTGCISPTEVSLTGILFHTAGQENMSPPCSPDLTLDRGFRDLKENKEPSPKVKRRRSVKISSVALEPAQWQNDALQILTCTNDYRSMNDFLMKKVQPNVLILLIHM